MERFSQIGQAKWHKTAVAIGKFEGLHAGHQTLVKKIMQKQQAGYTPVAFTFDVSPRLFLGQGKGVLFTEQERRSVFQEWGLPYLLECPFTKEFAAMSAQHFVEEVLTGQLHAAYLVVGEDFRFGQNRQGDVALLRRYAHQGLFELEVVEKESRTGRTVSSTWLREALEAGDMKAAEQMLGFPFFVDGTVVEGNRMGRTWGIPTANLCVPPEKILPPNGVYFSVVLLDGKEYGGITNIGSKPTIGPDYARGAETYLYDFDEDIYGSTIRVGLLEFRRGEQKFGSMEELVSCLKYDVDCGRHYFQQKKLHKFQENFGKIRDCY